MRARHRRQGGAITLLTLSALAFAVLLLLLAVNIGHALGKRDAADDAAEALGRLALMNQLSYRKTGGSDTPTVLRQADTALAQQLGDHDILYVFGNYNGTTFTALASQDPNPATTTFNAVALEVDVSLVNLGNLFDIDFGTVRGRSIATIDLTTAPQCRCENAVCAGKSGLALTLCMTTCLLGSVLRSVLNLVFTLNLSDFLATLSCIGQTLSIALNSAFTWVFGPGVVTLHITL